MSILRPRALLNVVLVLAIAATAAAAYVLIRRDGTSVARAAGRTVAVSRGTVVATVSASGTVTARATATADFANAGTVTSILVRPGDLVKRGQRLATIDARDASLALRAARVQLQIARDTLQTDTDDGAADSVLLQDQSAVLQARQTVRSAAAALDATYLTAPIAGTVLDVNGVVGQSSSVRVAAGGTSTSSSSTSTGSSTGSGGSSFIDIADLQHPLVRASFAEADVVRLKVGQSATVTMNAGSSTAYPARITAIDTTGTTSNSVVQYGVTLALTKAPATLRIGQTATVDITVARVAAALSVPAAAVTGSGTTRTVTVVDPTTGAQSTQPVTIGVEGDSTIQIGSGLSEGQRVLIAVTTSTTSTSGFPGGGFPGAGGLGAGFGGGAPGAAR